MPVWPYREITPETNRAQYNAARVFLQKKDTGNYENAGHGLLHGALIAADLNNADSVNAKLLRFAKDDYYYTSLATSHYNNHSVVRHRRRQLRADDHDGDAGRHQARHPGAASRAARGA